MALAGFAVGRLTGGRGGFAGTDASAGPAPSGSGISPATPRAAAAAAPQADWADRWKALSAGPPCPDTDAAMGAALQDLAGRDPRRALALALGEHNLRRRADWLHAALRGWAGADPEAAMKWIADLAPTEQEEAEGAVMDGAAIHPEAATALALSLVQGDPAAARSHANHLLSAFNRLGDYSAAVGFASSLPAEIRPEMLGTAYQYWAQAQPENALAAASALPEGEERSRAFDAALSGWSQVDPSGLATYAMSLPPGNDRAQAFQTALGEWVQLNPSEASAWMNTFEPKPEFDSGVAAVALLPQVVSSHPDVAAGWAESITDPALRSQTLAAVLRNWMTTDAAAARAYAQSCNDLQPADRATLSAGLGGDGSPP